MKVKWTLPTTKIKGIETIVFVVISLVLFYFLGVFELLFKAPYGLHFMRQSDGLAFALNYANQGNSFFEPELFNLKNIDGKGACEFPIIYYIAGVYFQLFGEDFSVIRVMDFLITWSGMIYLVHALRRVGTKFTLALLVVLLPLSSAVFNFYLVNYLPDGPALGFTFFALGALLIYRQSKSMKVWYAMLFFFLLATLLKVTYAIYPLAALLSWGIAEWKNRKGQALSSENQTMVQVISVILSLAILIGWNLYAIHYNTLNESTSFNTSAQPIWDVPSEERIVIWRYMSEYWNSSYFAQIIFHLFYLFSAVVVIFYKRITACYRWFLLFAALGGLCFFILFFKQFRDHDYYFLIFLPIVMMVYWQGIRILIDFIKVKWGRGLVFVLLSVIVFSGINHAAHKMNGRIERDTTIYDFATLSLTQKISTLEKLEIPEEAKVLVYPDNSQNGSLNVLNRKGWLIPAEREISPALLDDYKLKGASHFFYLQVDTLPEPNLGAFQELIVFQDDDLKVYQLDKKD
ncbi:Dolichyl-phosphate-mannose-protein mannosyltransferase [Lishizhenia tianjinensis]|uniref:Dolichyl-phosphate-mannose-protein mannosyltransferase n=1 Tax=Lishizhenia tianjinensis TaxID=477690 RepID=A0A1I7AES9_9FLAO|nr:glycosyltransferase family 39 protein [Lishizhenia tianjinensis]SFT73388.1 Dolichyl-phosphate-mannose-protein mannosyltransferase [Lishizhenia tianjinensis]